MKHSPAFLKIVEAARKTVDEVTIDQVLERRESGEAMHLVDVREDDKYRAGHAAGAVHIGKGVIERDIERKIPDKDASIVLYCGGGFRSVLAAESLRKMGYTHVDSMAGGYEAWCKRGLSTER